MAKRNMVEPGTYFTIILLFCSDVIMERSYGMVIQPPGDDDDSATTSTLITKKITGPRYLAQATQKTGFIMTDISEEFDGKP